MAGKNPAMPWYVNDWLSSARVTCMTLEQQGAYARLLCHCWASQRAAIPDDDKALAALSGMGEGWFKGGCQMVRDCFIPHPHYPGFLTNEKVFKLWEERQEWLRKSSEGGRKSADKRKLGQLKGGSTTVSTKRQPKGNSSSSSSSSIDNTPPNPLKGEHSGAIRSKKFDATDLPIPQVLDTPRFRKAWAQWVSHRSEIKKPVTATSGLKNLQTMAAWGESRAIAAIDHTILKGWQGLREPDGNEQAKPANGTDLFAGLRASREAEIGNAG